MSLMFKLGTSAFKTFANYQTRKFELALNDPMKAQKQLYYRWQTLKIWQQAPLSYEFTSGSSGPKKSIPYTSELKKSFSTMFILWTNDILRHAPVKLETGVLYMSISPRLGEHGGLEDDSAYVSPLIRPILRRFLAVDPSLQRVQNGEEFFFQLARELLSRKDLEIISIWSPTYFLSLLDYIIQNQTRLGFRGNFNDHWPKLKIISAWSSGESHRSFEMLKDIFPHVWFQGKGLLATEGPMTIPWIMSGSYLPLVNQIGYRFSCQDGSAKNLDELEPGMVYEIAPWFPNNENFYPMGDLVQCTGFYRKTPMLEFTGRKGDQSDMVGEKLSGPVLTKLCASYYGDFVVLPVEEPRHYVFLVDESSLKNKREAEDILQDIHHYKLARELNQLLPAKTVLVKGLRNKIQQCYAALNVNFGDQKDAVIIKRKEVADELYKWGLSISSRE